MLNDLFRIAVIVVAIFALTLGGPALLAGIGASLVDGLAAPGPKVVPAATIVIRPAPAEQVPFAPLVNEAARDAAQGFYGKWCSGYEPQTGTGPKECFPPGYFTWSYDRQRAWFLEQQK